MQILCIFAFSIFLECSAMQLLIYFFFSFSQSQKARPSVDNLPNDLVALLESCWEEDPNSRPEFQQITCMLTSFLSSLTSVQTTPPPVIELAQSSYLPVDSPGTRHLMDRSREGDEVKSGDSSKGFLGCFNTCFS